MNLNWLKSTPIAHRGFHFDDIPENSLTAFRLAIEEHFPIELDVHLLADNKIVVFHDDNLERMCGDNVPIQNLSSEQIKRYRLLNTNEGIPLLSEVLDLVNGRTPVLIEIKNQKRNRSIQKKLVDTIRGYNGEIAIQSFNPFALSLLPKIAPQIPRGQLSGSFSNENMNFIKKKLLQHYLLNFISKPHFVAHDISDINTNKTVRKLRDKGMLVLGWTIRSESSYIHAVNFCDNVIFEGFRPRPS